MKKLIDIASWLCIFTLATGCGKEFVFKSTQGGGPIVPVVETVSTKAMAGQHGRIVSTRTIAVSDSLELIETVYENTALIKNNTTKGEVNTTGNLASFEMQAYAEDEWHDKRITSGPGSIDEPNAPGFYFGTEVTKDGSDGWTMSSTQYWLNEVPISFWSAKDATLEMGGPTTAVFEHTVAGAAEDQTDPLIAYNREIRTYDSEGELKETDSTGGSTDEKLNIRFYHALSAVQFFSGNLSGTYRVSNIAIQGVNSHTTCTVTASPTVTPVEGLTSNLAFSYISDTPATFSQDYSSGDTSLARNGSAFDSSDGKTFIMIPQELGTDAKVNISFENAGGDETTSSFSLNGGEWEPGLYYVYEITLAGGVRVSIIENCTSTEKQNVRFKNDSNVSEYIRAAVVANWFDNNGNIIAPWNGNLPLGTNWVKSGGFYYYTQPVAAGEETEALISSFAKPTTSISGAHFEMAILVQAVDSDGVSSCQSAF